jgi:hypothetical protein
LTGQQLMLAVLLMAMQVLLSRLLVNVTNCHSGIVAPSVIAVKSTDTCNIQSCLQAPQQMRASMQLNTYAPSSHLSPASHSRRAFPFQGQMQATTSVHPHDTATAADCCWLKHPSTIRRMLLLLLLSFTLQIAPLLLLLPPTSPTLQCCC